MYTDLTEVAPLTPVDDETDDDEGPQGVPPDIA